MVFPQRIPIALLLPVFLFGGFFFFAPEASAAIVQCGFGSVGDGALGCNLCSLVALIDNIIRFILFLAAPIAALLFTYAGFLYFTSGGSEENVGKAKTIFKDVLFGFIIALCGYLIVDTLLRTLAEARFTGPGIGKIECVGKRQITPDGSSSLGGQGLVNQAAAYNAKIGVGECAPNNFSSFGSSANQMSCICARESAGQAYRPSVIDKSWIDGNSFSQGLMQINMVTTGPFSCDLGVGNGTQTFDCRKAFTAGSQSQLRECRNTPTGTRICGSAGYAYSVSDPALYQRCTNALSVPQCNFAAARYLYDRGGVSHWSTSASACAGAQ